MSGTLGPRLGQRTAAAVITASVACALGIALAAHHVVAASGGWQQMSPPVSPSPRVSASMAYDPTHHQLILFGGINTATSPPTALGDTWTWDGRTWIQLHPASSPSPRSAAGLAWDGSELVLFGGDQRENSASVLADTWTWDGSTWHQQSTAVAPEARGYMGLSWDGRETLLFGGWNPNSTQGGYGGDEPDTWTWSGTTTAWTQQVSASAPVDRKDPQLDFDPLSGKALLFGGEQQTILDDLWTYGQGGWHQLRSSYSSGSTPASGSGGMAFDAVGGHVLFPGCEPPATWRWDGSTWTQMSPPDPSARCRPAFAMDDQHQEIVMFGGTARDSGGPSLGDTWIWTPPSTQPSPSPPASPAPHRATAVPSASSLPNTGSSASGSSAPAVSPTAPSPSSQLPTDPPALTAGGSPGPAARGNSHVLTAGPTHGGSTPGLVVAIAVIGLGLIGSAVYLARRRLARRRL